MKVKVSETNMPKWGNVTVKFDVPEKLEALQEMSKNIFWTWTSEATDLFKDIDAELWRATAGNPVLMLQKLSYERLEEIAADKAMMTRINAVYKNFRKYMDEPRRTDMPSVAYFSMEYGLSNVLKIPTTSRCVRCLNNFTTLKPTVICKNTMQVALQIKP